MINKYSQGWRELNERNDRIKSGEGVIALLKRAITAERQDRDEKFPKCSMCGERFYPEAGSFRPNGKFMCTPCQNDTFGH